MRHRSSHATVSSVRQTDEYGSEFFLCILESFYVAFICICFGLSAIFKRIDYDSDVIK